MILSSDYDMEHEEEITTEIVRLFYCLELAKLTALKAANKLVDFDITIYTKNYSIGPDGVLEYDVVIQENLIPIRCPEYIEIELSMEGS